MSDIRELINRARAAGLCEDEIGDLTHVQLGGWKALAVPLPPLKHYISKNIRLPKSPPFLYYKSKGFDLEDKMWKYPSVGDRVWINPEFMKRYPKYSSRPWEQWAWQLVETGQSCLVESVCDCGKTWEIAVSAGVENFKFWVLKSNGAPENWPGDPPMFLRSQPVAEPKNNDGRDECFWYPGVRTKVVDTGFAIWRTCPNCGR